MALKRPLNFNGKQTKLVLLSFRNVVGSIPRNVSALWLGCPDWKLVNVNINEEDGIRFLYFHQGGKVATQIVKCTFSALNLDKSGWEFKMGVSTVVIIRKPDFCSNSSFYHFEFSCKSNYSRIIFFRFVFQDDSTGW